MKQKISVTQCRHHGKPHWRVRWREFGRVKRKFFTGRAAADSYAASLRGDALNARQRIAALPDPVIQTLLAAYDEAENRGLNLLTAVAGAVPGINSLPISEVLDEMEKAKQNAGRDDEYLSNLRQIVEAFSKGRERLAVEQFTVKDIEVFLDSKNIQYRSTLRSRLSTLFKFSVRRKYRKDNPCDQLEAVTHTSSPPEVLTVKETQKALKWLLEHPRSLAWFVLSTFAGLRPEEAEKTTWKDVNFDEGWIKVEAQTTKVRQRRVVYPMPIVFEWLKRAKKLKSNLPLHPRTRTRDRIELRKVLGWKIWKQDVTRHTAASYWLACNGETVAHVAKMLGHSEAVCESRYKAVKTQAEAEAFWKVVKAQAKA